MNNLLAQRLLRYFSFVGYAASPAGPLWELHFLSTIALTGIILVYLFLYTLTACSDGRSGFLE